MFYPMSAIITLFCSIIMEPLGETAKGDLERLESATKLIMSIPARSEAKSTDERIQFQMVEDFLDELIRLGRCAITKVERERGSDEEMDDIGVMGV